MTTIDFRDLPSGSAGISKIFNDYLYDFPKVRKYFSHDFHSLDSLHSHFPNIQKSSEHRQKLVEILTEQNTKFGCGQRTLDNIRLLKDQHAFCVVTGQQVGILGGPLYTLYKTLTAIRLARELSAKFLEHKFVPIFWLEGEDHDFEEINNTLLLTQENATVRIEYLPDNKPVEKNLGAVGELILGKSIGLLFEQIEKSLQQSEFRDRVLSLAKSAYKEGHSLNSAFVIWMNSLLGGVGENPDADPGLIYVSTNDKEAKRLLSPIFAKELEGFPQTSQLIIDQSAELEKEYHAQIKPKAINLFLFHKGGRYLIEPRENDFSLKGTRHFLTKDELLRIATETPELLSPNVVLRPICQDTLFPTAAYIAGPSEIAYFAQLKSVYEYFDIPMPLIYPRMSATIVEQKLLNVLEKYELELVSVYESRDDLNARVVNYISEVSLEELFGSSKKKIEEILNEMKFGLNYVDSTLLDLLESTRDKIEHHIQILHEKAIAAQSRRHATAIKQIDRLVNTLVPGGTLQERELNILYFMNKYGVDFPRSLSDRLQIDMLAHQIIEL